MKTAIVIVTYNRINLLKECIESALNQRNQEVEIFVINNASNDGTKDYIEQKENVCKKVHAYTMTDNLGGAGGFSKGLEYAYSNSDCDMFLLIDDDAMLSSDYLEKIYLHLDSRIYAYAGTVCVNGKIDISHRLSNKEGKIQREKYLNDTFYCDVATFCGILVRRSVIDSIGFPRSDFFIWHDDTEYSYRINKLSKILMVPSAKINHKTKVPSNNGIKDSWKEYYGMRNIIVIYKENGMYVKCLDKIIRCVTNALVFKIKSVIFCNNSLAYKYNSKLRINAVRDALFNNMGKNINYLP